MGHEHGELKSEMGNGERCHSFGQGRKCVWFGTLRVCAVHLDYYGETFARKQEIRETNDRSRSREGNGPSWGKMDDYSRNSATATDRFGVCDLIRAIKFALACSSSLRFFSLNARFPVFIDANSQPRARAEWKRAGLLAQYRATFHNLRRYVLSRRDCHYQHFQRDGRAKIENAAAAPRFTRS